MTHHKIPSQLSRMNLCNRVDYFRKLFTEFSIEQTLAVLSANSVFGTHIPPPEFDKLAGDFRTWALALYPTFAEHIEWALYDARFQYFNKKDPLGESQSSTIEFALQASGEM